MAYATDHHGFGGLSGNKASARDAAAGKKLGLLRRFYEAIIDSRQTRANRDISDFIERSGGRLTDDLERQMMQRFLASHDNFRR